MEILTTGAGKLAVLMIKFHMVYLPGNTWEGSLCYIYTLELGLNDWGRDAGVTHQCGKVKPLAVGSWSQPHTPAIASPTLHHHSGELPP